MLVILKLCSEVAHDEGHAFAYCCKLLEESMPHIIDLVVGVDPTDPSSALPNPNISAIRKVLPQSQPLSFPIGGLNTYFGIFGHTDIYRDKEVQAV